MDIIWLETLNVLVNGCYLKCACTFHPHDNPAWVNALRRMWHKNTHGAYSGLWRAIKNWSSQTHETWLKWYASVFAQCWMKDQGHCKVHWTRKGLCVEGMLLSRPRHIDGILRQMPALEEGLGRRGRGCEVYFSVQHCAGSHPKHNLRKWLTASGKAITFISGR